MKKATALAVTTSSLFPADSGIKAHRRVKKAALHFRPTNFSLFNFEAVEWESICSPVCTSALQKARVHNLSKGKRDYRHSGGAVSAPLIERIESVRNNQQRARADDPGEVRFSLSVFLCRRTARQTTGVSEWAAGSGRRMNAMKGFL